MGGEKPDRAKESIIGIQVIESIVTKVSSSALDPTQIISAIKQIIFFYKLLPKEWKTKAFYIFSRLWEKKLVIFSTNPEAPQQIYDVKFDDERINSVMRFLPDSDKSAMIMGKSMLDLISRGLHGDSDSIKQDVQIRYENRGLNIVNILTTGDIEFLIDEIEDLTDKKKVLTVFNWWAENYTEVTLLIQKDGVDKDSIKNEIVGLAKSLKKEYILLHSASNNIVELAKTQTILEELLKKDKILKFKSMDCNIKESGFCYQLDVIIKF